MARSVRVRALYRYPVKGFTREECDRVMVLPGGRIAGDRVLGLRFDDAEASGDAWGPKRDFAALVNTPALAALRVSFDHATHCIRVWHGDDVLFDDVLYDEGRTRFASAIERYLISIDASPDASNVARFPLRVVGDGTTARFQDREPGYVTLHGWASAAAVASAVGEAPDATERRFRSNVVVDGLDRWEEQRWIGSTLRIGDVEFNVANPVARCLATHANPDTGRRDLPVMQTLLQVFPAARPTLGVLMTSERGGVVRVGDDVEAARSTS